MQASTVTDLESSRMLRLVRLACTEVHAARSELRDVLTRATCAFEDVLAPCDLEVLEAGGHDRGLELCFKQSSGDSVSP